MIRRLAAIKPYPDRRIFHTPLGARRDEQPRPHYLMRRCAPSQWTRRFCIRHKFGVWQVAAEVDRCKSACRSLPVLLFFVLVTCQMVFGQQPPRRTTTKSQTPASQPMLPPGFKIRHLDTGEPIPRQYAVFIPRHYKPDRPWPVLVFLHGSGECGTNTLSN